MDGAIGYSYLGGTFCSERSVVVSTESPRCSVFFFSISSFTLYQDKDSVSGKASQTGLQRHFCLPKMDERLPFLEITRSLLTSILDKSIY